MSAPTLPIAIVLQPNERIRFEGGLMWPRNVPSRADARRALFGGADVPPALEAGSRRFFSRLSVTTREQLGIEVTSPAAAAFCDALVTLWRVEVALSLPVGAEFDDDALKLLLDEVCSARDALEGTKVCSAELTAAMAETHRELLPAWTALTQRAAASTPCAARPLPRRQPHRVPAPKRTSFKQRLLAALGVTP